jgi:pimeloyl-ACP methyl ester carboxylesterase
MATFSSDGVTLAYDDVQPPGWRSAIVLLHGFSSNRAEGWRRTGWHQAFERRGVRCIALDQRGHGESAKLYDPSDYAREKMAADVLALMDHLELDAADLFGFSMGTRVALQAALSAPGRVTNLILGGVGGKLLEPSGRPSSGMTMAEAMLAGDPESISSPFLKSFRHFADEQGEDRKALAAVSQAPGGGRFDPDDLMALPAPVLVVAGRHDESAGDPDALAAAFAEGYGVTIPGCDHFSIITHGMMKASVFDFLDGTMAFERR